MSSGRRAGCAGRGRRIVHRKGEDRVRRRWFWIILIIVLLIAGGLTAGRMRAPKAAPVQQAEEVIPGEVAPVEPATLERTVEVSGSLTSARMTEVQPRRSGPVARVLVGEGEYVKAGRPLVVLDSSEAALRVQQAEAAVEGAQARVALLESGARAQERVQVADTVRQGGRGGSNTPTKPPQ